MKLKLDENLGGLGRDVLTAKGHEVFRLRIIGLLQGCPPGENSRIRGDSRSTARGVAAKASLSAAPLERPPHRRS
jgi:hypothetical protein